MWWLRLVPAVLSCVALGAHVLRGASSFDGWFIAVCIALLPVLLWSKQKWVPRLLAVLLLATSPVWLWTAWQVSGERIASDLPFIRMVVILSGVTLFFWWSAWLLTRPRVKLAFEIQNHS